MPHINRIRVNNVKYNFGTQSYDDFVMRLSGKNTIYDLANGGGKSILMLLLLQNMIPNCTLDEKQPIEKLFRAGNDNKVIHSLIEWKLSPVHVKDGFKYMTTGFCARKAKEDSADEKQRSTAPVEYFNYCIFYREVNANDIVNLPLVSNGEKVTYQGLKNYLRELGKKDYSLMVYIFDKKGDYQRFVSQYGIYESEWELIRGINKTEGHVRTFFETNYKTTRKVVEDLFIEDIIEKSYKTRWEEEDGQNIAKTLLDIKDKLVELAKKKGEIEHFDHQADALAAFCERLHSMRGIYEEKAGYEEALVKTSRTVNSRFAGMKAEFEEDSAKLEEFNHRLTEIEKEIEQGKIAIEESYYKDLLEETNNLKDQCTAMEEDYKAREKKLLLCEAANSYFEYIENEKLMKIQNNAIFDMTGGNGDLLEELHALSYHLTKIENSELNEAEDKCRELEMEYNKCLVAYDEYEALEKKKHTQLAIAKNELEKNENAAKEAGRKLEEKRQLSNLALAEDVYEEIKQKENLLLQTKDETAKLRSSERSFIEMLARMETRKKQSDEQLNNLEKRRNECRQKLDNANELLENVRKIELIYKETDEELLRIIEQSYRNNNNRLAQLEEENVQLNNRIFKLQDNGKENVLSENKDFMHQVLSYIKRHYDENAMLGEDFISTMDSDECRELFLEIPYITGTIVMHENLEAASMDETLCYKIPQNQNVVLLLADKSSEIKYDGKNMSVIANMPISLIEDDKRHILINKIETEIGENEKQIENLRQKVTNLRDDLFVVEKYLHNDKAESQKLKEEYASLNEESNRIIEESESFAVNYSAQKNALAQCSEKIENNESIQKNIMEELKVLEDVRECYANYAALDNVIASVKKEISEYEKELTKAADDLHKATREVENLSGKLDVCRKNIALHKEALARYAVYKTDKEYPDIEVDKEDLEQIFGGKVLAFEEKNSDISDKKKMAELYRSQMQKNEADIKYKNFTVEELSQYAQAGTISVMSMEELAAEKEKLSRARNRYEDMIRESAHKQSQFDRQAGTLEHGKRSYHDKFGEDYANQKAGEPLLGLQKFVSEGSARLKLAKAEGDVLRQKLRTREKELISIEALSSELANLIENYDIRVDAYSGELPPDTDLAAECKKVRGDYQRLSKQEQKCRESFEKDKAQLIETLNLLEAEELAVEVSKQLVNPANVKDVERYIDNLNETISFIRLEKSRINQSIEHMEIMKENFVRQCMQTCVSIKESLERLPKLSNIVLDGKSISMVQLHIPYIDESEYEQAMDNYISMVVENVDALPTPAERIKYIRSQLAWKRLFSVLVKDMDKIKLNLYKRERIKEQSRYLKYEEAVGSTGQSQGIYIQFLVAVINYISSMNSGNGQGELLRKVIFIDNPFGAAKDVYIWEPIFAMLKSNHVQLIVPARGVTPAITGRFEVNYILGQKIIGGKSQTVVVDYRSQVEEDMLEYKELEYIQSTFNFD